MPPWNPSTPMESIYKGRNGSEIKAKKHKDEEFWARRGRGNHSPSWGRHRLPPDPTEHASVWGGCERLGMNRHSMRTQIDERETNPRERACGGEMNQRAACDLMCKIKISTTVAPLIGMWDHLVSWTWCTREYYITVERSGRTIRQIYERLQ